MTRSGDHNFEVQGSDNWENLTSESKGIYKLAFSVYPVT